MSTLRQVGGPGSLSRLFAVPSGPAPSFETVRWELIGGQGTAGSWGLSDRQNRARALTSFRGVLYAGIGAAQAEVWRLVDGSWELIGGGGVFGNYIPCYPRLSEPPFRGRARRRSVPQCGPSQRHGVAQWLWMRTCLSS